MEEIIVIQGTELKLILTISGLTDTQGNIEANYNLEVKVFTQPKDKTILDENRILDIEGSVNQKLLLIDTSVLTPGILNLEITLDIPDDDFVDIDDGNRREIYRESTNIKIIK